MPRGKPRIDEFFSRMSSKSDPIIIKSEPLTDSETRVKQEPSADNKSGQMRETDTQPCMLVKLKLEKKIKQETYTEHEPDAAQSILGKRARKRSCSSLSSDGIEQDVVGEEDNSGELSHNTAVQTMPNGPDDTSNIGQPISAPKKKQSQWVEARQGCRQKLKTLPKPEHVGKYAKAEHYRECMELVTDLSKAFENCDKSRIEAGRKSKAANKVIQSLKEKLKATKAEIDVAEAEISDLRTQLIDATTNSTEAPNPSADPSTGETDVKMEDLIAEHRKSIANLEASVKEEQIRAVEATEKADRAQSVADELQAKIEVERKAKDDAARKILMLQGELAEYQDSKYPTDTNMQTLISYNASQATKIQELRLEVTNLTKANAYHRNDHAIQQSHLRERCQFLENEVDVLKKRDNEREQQFKDRIAQVMGGLRDFA